MYPRIMYLIYVLFFAEVSHAETCNVDLSPKDTASKYIEAIKCLNQNLVNLQSQIDGLRTTVIQASADAASSQAAAEDAKAATEKALGYAQDTNAKLDRMFKKDMMR